ncbi:MAG TPA: IS1634 family transposase [Candidatus Limnocylindrales bacterium]|nr:IS1634 family transposase [Candidatus Limnocylindrales bacterium]
MPSLTPKIIGGHTYYYARYCQRVEGKPKIVRQVYLGKIDDLVAAAEFAHQPPQPLETEVAAFADVAALLDIAQRLDLVQLLDSILPPKRHQGLSVGRYLLLAAINRAVSPTSKLQFTDWYRQTVLTRLLPADPAALSSQNFWNHMDLVTPEHVLECEKQITQRLIQRFQLDLRALVYDGTNFFTYINTRTPAELPQRGHNKQKRGDLRQVSLGLLVSADFHIPLFHKVYAGNVNDSTEFRSITEELSTHYRQLAESCDHITLVFDKGNNSEESFESLQNTPFHFVGSLVPSQHSELLAVSRRQFRTISQAALEGVEVYRTQKKVFGQLRTIVVTFNQNLYDGQLQGLTTHLSKARRKLRDLQTQLQRRREGKVKGGKAPTLDSVKKQIHTICSAQFVEKILPSEVQQLGKGLDLTFRTDQAALDRLCRIQFGKTILFTDNTDWADEQIVMAYRSQYHIEDAFKQMKNPHFLGWSPMFHWTDSKIQVHAFYCVLALLLTSLLQRELAQKGEPLSINRLLEELGGIRETLVVYPRRQGQRQASTATCLTRMTASQRRLFSLLDLQRFVPAAR